MIYDNATGFLALCTLALLRLINCNWSVRQWVASSDGLISLSGNPPCSYCYCCYASYVLLHCGKFAMFCCRLPSPPLAPASILLLTNTQPPYLHH